MKRMASDWYKKVWTLDIKDQSWVEDTKRQVDFLIDKLALRPGGRVLDLACGFGRHSLELARRGLSVVGVDITPDYIDYARAQAENERLDAKFIRSDIRDVDLRGFDAVINMADGAVGYLENDAENLKIFEVVSRALKPGGRHFMDIMNGSYADSHFPCRMWEAGEKCLTLSAFEWDSAARTLIYGQLDYRYGEPLPKPDMSDGNPIRLYTLDEVKEIFAPLGMEVTGSFSDFEGRPSSDNGIQLMVRSVKA